MLALPIFTASHPATIVGANELNFCVRDGNRWTLIAINTNYADGSSPSFMSKRFRALTPSSSPRFLHRLNTLLPGFQSKVTNHGFTGILRLRNMETEIMYEELVTRTGFEPMLKA